MNKAKYLGWLALLSLLLLGSSQGWAHTSAPSLEAATGKVVSSGHDHPVSPAAPAAPAAAGVADGTAAQPAASAETLPAELSGTNEAPEPAGQSQLPEGTSARVGMGGHGMGAPGELGFSMTHPGLSSEWMTLCFILMAGITGWALGAPVPGKIQVKTLNLSSLPVIGRVVDAINATPVYLFLIKVLTVSAFILVVVAGLFGTVYPERNLATVLVWNWWWPLVVVSVFFLGSAWCAICPWDTLASWLVRRRLWKRATPHPGLNRKVPRRMQNVWPALLMLIGLTWLELGVGVTSIPMATALMALVMLGLSIVFLLLYERKAFCRYACPVGRTLGFYSRLAPIAIRPKEQDICAGCKTLECYKGSETVEPCPTHLTVGKFSQNTFCLSCGNCVFSCPYKNVSWRLRTMGSEAADEARPLWDGAWFMLCLLGITTFHGVTMMPDWTDMVLGIARALGESGQLIWSFTIGMLAGFMLPVLVYAVAIGLTLWLAKAAGKGKFRQLFVALPFSTLPLAFTYHLAHNLSHLFGEGGGVLGLFFNPLGTGLAPMSGMERHDEMMNAVVQGDVLFGLQSALIVLGVWLGVQILRHRGRNVLGEGESVTGMRLIPMLAFIIAMAGANLWLLSQDMVMRF